MRGLTCSIDLLSLYISSLLFSVLLNKMKNFICNLVLMIISKKNICLVIAYKIIFYLKIVQFFFLNDSMVQWVGLNIHCTMHNNVTSTSTNRHGPMDEAGPIGEAGHMILNLKLTRAWHEVSRGHANHGTKHGHSRLWAKLAQHDMIGISADTTTPDLLIVCRSRKPWNSSDKSRLKLPEVLVSNSHHATEARWDPIVVWWDLVAPKLKPTKSTSREGGAAGEFDKGNLVKNMFL